MGKPARRQKQRRRQKDTLKQIEDNQEAMLEHELNKPKLGPLEPQTESQEKLIRQMKAKRLVFVNGSAGTGKAQPLTARIRTPGGWSTMGDMQVGVPVVTPDGSVTKVTGVHPQGLRPTYRFTFSDGRATEADMEHLWKVWVTGKHGKLEWQVLNTLTVADLIETGHTVSIPLTLPYSAPERDLPYCGYLVGLVVVSGVKTPKGILLTTPLDVEQVKRLEASLEGTDLTLHESTKSGFYYIAGTDEDLETLISFKLDITNDYLLGSINQRKTLLHGILVGCTTGIDNRPITVLTVHRVIWNAVTDIVRSLGGLAKDRILVKERCFEVTITHPEMDWLLSIDDDHDCSIAWDQKKLPIKSVIFEGMKECQCISVEHEDRLYITDDYVVTHNTFCSTSYATEQLMEGNVERLIITRPMVGCDEEMGFLPGNELEKFQGWVDPFLDVLYGKLGRRRVETFIKYEKIVVRPLMRMRGITFHDSFVLLDEAQNTTVGQMKMFLTRLGMGSRVVVNGDITQTDLPKHVPNGLSDILSRVTSSATMGVVHFNDEDITRDPLVREIVAMYKDQPKLQVIGK